MRNKIFLTTFSFLFLFLIQPVYAHCPLCTAATGVAIAVARWYGIDDAIVGLFVGGLIISTAIWFNNILKKRNKGKEYFAYQGMILVFASLLFTFISFYFGGLIDTGIYTLFGIDKLVVGILLGSFVSWLAFYLHDVLRQINKNKNYLPFQAIVLALLLLSLTGVSFYFIGWV